MKQCLQASLLKCVHETYACSVVSQPHKTSWQATVIAPLWGWPSSRPTCCSFQHFDSSQAADQLTQKSFEQLMQPCKIYVMNAAIKPCAPNTTSQRVTSILRVTSVCWALKHLCLHKLGVDQARAYSRGGLGLNPPWAWYFTELITCAKEINCFRILLLVDLST